MKTNHSFYTRFNLSSLLDMHFKVRRLDEPKILRIPHLARKVKVKVTNETRDQL